MVPLVFPVGGWGISLPTAVTRGHKGNSETKPDNIDGMPVKIENETGQQSVNSGDLGYRPTGSAFCIFFGPTPIFGYFYTSPFCWRIDHSLLECQ